MTAGHCSADGTLDDVYRSEPAQDDAGGGSGSVALLDEDPLGTWGFSQFGGPGHTPGEENSPTSTDIGVIDLTNSAVTALPAVTDWTTSDSNDLAASTTPIKGVADPQPGALSKSGRTSGLTSGSTTVELLDTEGNRRPFEILDGYLLIDDRWVHGFLGGQFSAPGDSGGAVFQGDQAVGVVSGGPMDVPPEDDFTWSTRLADALELTSGYTVMLDIDEPQVIGLGSGNTAEPGDAIAVTMPNNATELRVERELGEVEVIAAEGGSASFLAPETIGDYSFSLTATNGFSESATVGVDFEVKTSTLRPTVTDQRVSAAAGATTAEVAISGTGIAGATVTVSGLPEDETAEATVDTDGTWTTEKLSFTIGEHTVYAAQEVDGESSATTSATFTIAPAAPVITSISPDQTFPAGSAPTSLSGEGLAGAQVSVTMGEGDNAAIAAAVVNADGTWSATIEANAPGDYVATVTQTLTSVTSDAASVAFAVSAAPGGGGRGGGGLADTGGFPVLPFMLGATALALIAAGALFRLAQRRAQLAE